MIRGISRSELGLLKQEIQDGCPNGCGELTIMQTPIPRLYLIPTDLIELGQEHIEGFTTMDEEKFGYIYAVCPLCGGCYCTTHEEDSWFFEIDNPLEVPAVE